MALKSGPNDVSHLAPGVYFACEPAAAGQRPALYRVVVAR